MDDAMHPCLLEEVATGMDSRRWDVCTVLIAKQPMDKQWNDWSRAARLPLSTRAGAFAAWRRELSERVGWFDERFAVAGDKEFWHRLAAAHLRIGLVPKILYLYTRNPESLSAATRQSERWQNEKALLAQTGSAWPAALKRQIQFIRLLRTIRPSRYVAELPSSVVT
jgi:hypothetical protein